MRKVDLKEQKRVSGGTHWHWKCSVTPYISPTKFSSSNEAWYYAGVHAEKYSLL